MVVSGGGSFVWFVVVVVGEAVVVGYLEVGVGDFVVCDEV